MKLVVRHVGEEYIEKIEDIRHTTGSKELYMLRSQAIERVFADAKEFHSMRYAKDRWKNYRLNLIRITSKSLFYFLKVFYKSSNYSENNEEERYKIEIVIKRKEFKLLEDIIEEFGVSNPTLKIKTLSKVHGKITTTRVKEI
ncbi:hypothetical protein ACF3M2_16615 [Tissierella carlieri]|uniref:hypothetical protein n=1 Tax=Tissierella carlieri TaxID=689904 RepID=UPI00280393F1|nr:hypothetical protein [uncultured Tissierella sp.]MDU5083367.1 hypothetical protein [Bacillota bacterium]